MTALTVTLAVVAAGCAAGWWASARRLRGEDRRAREQGRVMAALRHDLHHAQRSAARSHGEAQALSETLSLQVRATLHQRERVRAKEEECVLAFATAAHLAVRLEALTGRAPDTKVVREGWQAQLGALGVDERPREGLTLKQLLAGEGL